MTFINVQMGLLKEYREALEVAHSMPIGTNSSYNAFLKAETIASRLKKQAADWAQEVVETHLEEMAKLARTNTDKTVC